MTIRFRCPRCNHRVKADDKTVGQSLYCPTCYYKLIVPAESTVKAPEEIEVYGVDAVPVDVRDMKDRQQTSYPCPICHALIAITPEMPGTTTICPDCGTSVAIPADVSTTIAAEALPTLRERPILPPPLPGEESNQLYGLRQTASLPGVAYSSDAALAGPEVFPVWCRLCGTIMHATEEQIGTELTCPDCETKTLVRRPAEKLDVGPHQTQLFEGGNTYEITDLDVPPGTRLVPVVCSLCHTRMYAPESDIGGTKICPDCGRENPIVDVPEKQKVVYELTGKSYGVGDQPTAPRPVFRIGIDYRKVEGSLDMDHWRERPVAEQRPPGQPDPTRPALTSPPPETDSQYDYRPLAEKANLPNHPAARPPKKKTPKTGPTPPSPLPPPLPETSETIPLAAVPEISVPEKIVPEQDIPAASPNDYVPLARRTAMPSLHRRLPPFPLLNRLLTPFFRLAYWSQLSGVLMLASVSAFLTQCALSAIGGIDSRMAAFSMAGVFVMCCFLSVLSYTIWIGQVVNHWISVFTESAGGGDSCEEPIEFDMAVGLGMTLWFCALHSISGALGWLALPLLPAVNDPATYWLRMVAVTQGVTFFLFPVLFLSTMENGSYFNPISLKVLKSFIAAPLCWLRFYFVALIVPVLVGGAFRGSLYVSGSGASFLVRFLAMAGVFATVIFAGALYFRILGRHAWVLSRRG